MSLKVFGTDIMPPGLPLKHPILVATNSAEEAAKILRVSVYHLTKHPLPYLSDADKARALACPRTLLRAEGARYEA